MTKENVLLFWTGGKNCALFLHHLKSKNQYNVSGLISMFDIDINRIPKHGVTDYLVKEQTKLLNIALQRIFIKNLNALNEAVFDQNFFKIFEMYFRLNIKKLAFGIQSPNDFTKMIEEKLSPLGFTFLYAENSNENIDYSQFNFLITSINKNNYDINRLAQKWDPEFEKIEAENNFHTFTLYSPEFKNRLSYSKAIAEEENEFLVTLLKGI